LIISDADHRRTLRTQQAPLPESELVRQEADSRTLARAEALVEEEADEVWGGGWGGGLGWGGVVSLQRVDLRLAAIRTREINNRGSLRVDVSAALLHCVCMHAPHIARSS